MRLFIASLSLLALAGCSSYQAKESDSVPAERLLGFQQDNGASAKVEVARDLGFLGGGCMIALQIDRQPAALIAVGESASFHLPPGQHIVGIGIDDKGPGLCSRGHLRRELAVDLTSGQTAQLRILSDANSGFDILPAQR
ncbi:3-isopropylmalate dehydratase [Pseudomonas citronellolis]|uniref:3-isopropylmalate dehydratase n=1 Tax=Pseudomonas citronellolis TaxID=53408 RepID=UPI0023E381B1|nr:3-isopropylmalate dehydratase [Pseudomonas citronellolis]MDF3931741.1 3-isopropylmalate dehydratase [Pseudomonas citronellolis]